MYLLAGDLKPFMFLKFEAILLALHSQAISLTLNPDGLQLQTNSKPQPKEPIKFL